MAKRPKKDSVLVKHKKWLSDLQKTKERLETQYIDDLRRKEEDKQRVSSIYYHAHLSIAYFALLIVSRPREENARSGAQCSAREQAAI